MATPRFLQITFNFGGSPKTDELKSAFDKAQDWVRISQNSWIVWTNLPPEVWYTILKPNLGPNDQFYIFGIDNFVRQGWAPKWLWEWLDKKR